eukprot:773847-Pelagomonas_calceolata.AAC.2
MIEQATRSDYMSPACDLSDAQDDAEGEQHATFDYTWCTPSAESSAEICHLIFRSSSSTLQCLFPGGSIPVLNSPCTILKYFRFR